MRSVRTALAYSILLVSVDASAQPGLLNDILNKVTATYNRREQPVVIFDIDGTLLDNRARNLAIMQEYGRKELKRVRPNDYRKLQGLTMSQIHYTVKDTLAAVGVTESGVINNAVVYWSQRFYTDDYLKHDTDTPGSVNFVRTLYSAGARIVYLTGRDVPRQLIGTAKALRAKGYPIGIQGTELIMKPAVQQQDAVFKQRVTDYLRHYGKVVATFDNEPANANVYRRAFKEAVVVLYQAPHTPNPPPLLQNIVPLSSFMR